MIPNEGRFPSWGSYPSIFNLGHAAAVGLRDQRVYVQEKVDGSQFSFGVDLDGQLHARSKGAIINIDDPEGMFSKGIENIKAIAHLLIPGWTYRGEYLQKPKHNVLAYDRVPKLNIILFDIQKGPYEFLNYGDVFWEADRLGFEVVPLLMTGVPTLEDIQRLLQTDSILGGQKIEGMVLKPVNYDLYGTDKKVLMGKYVSEAFKEVHKAEWKGANPASGDFIDLLGQKYKSQARWNKAIIHLREKGLIEDTPRDIGRLMKEIPEDILEEAKEAIRDELFNYAWGKIKRIVVARFPEWYKEQLLKKQFEDVGLAPDGAPFVPSAKHTED